MKKKNPWPSAQIANFWQQRKYFKMIDTKKMQTVQQSGTLINNFMKRFILVDNNDVHTLVIGTTASGKSRKHAMIITQLAITAKESIVFNDCKKEFYYLFKNQCLSKGYSVYLMDFRNFEYSDSYNPLTLIVDAYQLSDIALVDELVNDLVNQLVVHNPRVEPIWQNGERALLKAMILLVINAPIDNKYKNLYTVSNTLNYLVSHKSNKGSMLKEYINSLPDNHSAKIAFGALNAVSDNIEMSLITSALTTLHIYSSLNVAKVTSFDDFKIADLINQDHPTALFIVNPDEKMTYNSLTALLYQQIYTYACKKANMTNSGRLKTRLNLLFDEFGNMPYINNLSNMITVARSRNIIFYLYVQDFAQMNNIYNENVAKVIRANCNCWVFIGSSDTNTCKEIEAKIGYRYSLIKQYAYHKENHRLVNNNINCNYQKLPLISYSELMQMDNTSGNKTIVMRTYFPIIIANLPDISQYCWYDKLKLQRVDDEDIKSERAVSLVFPHIYNYALNPNQFINVHYWSNKKLAESVINSLVVKHIASLDQIDALVQQEINRYVE